MTLEQITQWAKEAGMNLLYHEYPDQITAFANLVAEHEREQCALLVDSAPEFGLRVDTANAIRARKP